MQKKLNELKEEFGTDLKKGLSSEQVAINKEKYGSNVLEAKKKKSWFVRFLLQFKDPLIIILLIAAIVSVVVDYHEWVESLIILIVVMLNAILGIYQENKAEKSLESLKKMSALTCKVIRDDIAQTINTEDLVVGDIILVEAGDVVPADARIIECSNLMVEEASLTGESVAVTKNNEYIESEDIAIGDMKNSLFSSTSITNGKAKAIVTNVGMHTEIGKIAKLLNEQTNELTPLQHKLSKVGKIIGLMSLIICALVFVLEMIAASWDVNHFSEAFITAVALAVAAIPEGLATVVTIVLSIGVTKLSKQNAIIKKLPAVETLGSCTVICSDKTGTLTQNKMTVVKLFNKELKTLDKLTKEDKDLIKYFAICCDAYIDNVDGKEIRIGDPTELALLDLNNKYGSSIKKYKRVLDLPFDSDRKLMTTVIKDKDKYIAITKGATDKLIYISNNKKDDLLLAITYNGYMADEALRVLSLGIKVFDTLPKEEDLEKDITFLGMVGMIDPARIEVKDAIQVATKAGIKTVMITGDHILTAKAIAKDLNILKEGDLAIDSRELNKLSDEYLAEHIHEYSVFARVAPKDKVRIVEAWQKNDAVVSMTGDGVNDAPALKKADIGCAMGITGTDVSKETADVILTDDNFATIVSAVKEGRGIYDNIRKCIKYLLSSNIGEVLTIFVASLLSAFGLINLGTPLSAMHLLWINLITDSLPAFGIGMEAPDDDIMERKPRPRKEGIFANGYGWKIALEGILIGALTLTSYIIGEITSHALGQTMAFLTLSSTQLFHAYNVKSNFSIFNKKTYKNKFMNFAFLIGFVLQLFVIYCPGVNTLFGLQSLDIISLLISLGLAFSIVVIFEVYKLIRRLKNK